MSPSIESSARIVEAGKQILAARRHGLVVEVRDLEDLFPDMTTGERVRALNWARTARANEILALAKERRK